MPLRRAARPLVLLSVEPHPPLSRGWHRALASGPVAGSASYTLRSGCDLLKDTIAGETREEMREFFEVLKSITDVQALIDAAHRETETLEYKAAMSPFSDQQKNEIGKDVSALANSSGGVIIYGVSNDPADPTRPTSISGINPKNIETFDRVVNSAIRPMIVGIERRCLPSDNPRVMAVYVPQSEHSPHQNSDNKYYHRSGTESRPMGHDLVELHFGRRRSPVLSIEIAVLRPLVAFTGEPAVSNDLVLRVFVNNTGKRAARYVQAIFKFPPAEQVSRLTAPRGAWQNIDDLYSGRQVRQFSENTGIFHAESETSVLEIQFGIARAFAESAPETPLIEWTLAADEMSARRGSFSLKDLGIAAP